MKTIKLSALLIILLELSALADNSGASFLKISPGARPVGIGGAFTAVNNDINCLYYNPAGLGSLNKTAIGAMHTRWVSDIKYNYAAGAFKFKGGIAGIAATYLSMGELEGRDDNRQETGDFSAYDFSLQASYAKKLKNNYYAGGSLKLIRQQIEEETASGVAIDAGYLKELSENVNIGVALRNIGPKMTFLSTGYNLPLTASAGLGFSKWNLMAITDINYEIIDEKLKLSVGLEYTIFKLMAFRIGYFRDVIRNDFGSEDSNLFKQKNGLSGGIGISVLNYSVDYAMVPYAELGNTHRISLGAKF